jgi:D-alanyl-lipoteichoic acid acyltransferase DltB (MBOAT superfamily)
MEIISLKFALLSIASIFIFYLIHSKYRIGFLTILSCGFIATYNYTLLIYILGYSLVNFYIGIKIPDSRNKIALYRIGVIINLSQLIILKYASFAIDPLVHIFDSNLNISKLSEIITPIGISFFTLQGIGYLINVKMGWEKPERKFQDFLLYIAFFPKFLSGPIERSNNFLPKLKVSNPFNEQHVTEGLRIMLFGFFKKVVIATNLGTIVTQAHTHLDSFNGTDLWIVTLIQPLYLYFDFSGYTDIAIGLAKMFGIDLLPNFNRPFLAENMTNFWKRFHISLSSWFNDYIFKQLSFKYRRWGKSAAVFAVFVTWTLFGIWHGAGWNFMALGFLQASAIIYEFFTKAKRTEIGLKIPVFWRVMLSRMITYVFYGISLVFFFSPNLNSSLHFYSKLVDFSSWIKPMPLYHLLLFALCCSFVFLFLEYLKEDHKELSNRIIKIYHNSRFMRISIYYIMVLLILIFIGKKLTFVYQVF